MTNTITTNVTSTPSINTDDKNVTCEKSNSLIPTILLVVTVSLVLKCLLLSVVISIRCYYYYTRHLVKKEYTLRINIQ